MTNVLDKVAEKSKSHISYSIHFCGKSFHLCGNVEKYGNARQATADNTVRRMCFA